jgi:hypothetical protein
MLIARRAVERRWRRTWPAVLALCSLTAGLGRLNPLEAQQAATPPPSRQSGAADCAAPGKAAAKQPRIREGTALVEQPGVFQKAGDRMTFFTSDGQRRFVVLENLQLERISRAVGDNLTPPQWTVSGLVTEFCGANYLFVDRAVLRATGPSGQQEPRPWAVPHTVSLPPSSAKMGDVARP